MATEEKKENLKKMETPIFAILQPRISEKSGKMAQSGKYVFLVKPNSNKIEIRKNIEKSYKVHVTQVNIIRNSGKTVRYGRTTGRRSAFKKAVVTLKKGESLEAEKIKE